jgi:hypothetical protein
MRGVESLVPQLICTGEIDSPTDPAPRELSTGHTPIAIPPASPELHGLPESARNSKQTADER